MERLKKIIKKIFGGLNITWPKLILFSVIMGVYTALVAMFTHDGSSFHDIAATLEWWVLPAMIIIMNSKKPLEAALKTFVFFLISQPLVYLVEVPFSDMGWNLFQFYPHWFFITLATPIGAFVCWYIKKDEWYSAIILSIVTSFLAILGVGFVGSFIDNPPNHLITTIYCFASIPIYIFTLSQKKSSRIIAVIITAIALVLCVLLDDGGAYQVYDGTFIEENRVVLVGEPYVSESPTGKGQVNIIKNEEGYNFEIIGVKKEKYEFSISDDENKYDFEYYYDKEQQTVVIKLR